MLLFTSCFSLISCGEDDSDVEANDKNEENNSNNKYTTKSNLVGNINVYSKEENDGIRENFFNSINAANATFNNDYLVENAITKTTDEDIIKSVAEDKNAIGFISLTSLEEATGVTAIAYDETDPLVSYVLYEMYDLSNWISYVSIDTSLNTVESQLIKEFNRYLETTPGKTKIESLGLAVTLPPLNVSYTPGSICSSSKTDIRIGGSSVDGLASEIISSFSSRCSAFNPVESYTISEDADKVFSNDEQIHIGFSATGSRESWQSTEAKNANVFTFDIAKNGIAIIVNDENTITNITESLLQQIFVKAGVKHNNSLVASNSTNLTKWEDL